MRLGISFIKKGEAVMGGKKEHTALVIISMENVETIIKMKCSLLATKRILQTNSLRAPFSLNVCLNPGRGFFPPGFRSQRGMSS